MKTIFTLLFAGLFFCSYSRPLLITSNDVKSIGFAGTSDTAITLNRIILVEFITYNGNDSTATVSFNQYRSVKQLAAKRQIQTDVPVEPLTFKIPSGTVNICNYVLNQAVLYYQSLHYSVTKL